MTTRSGPSAFPIKASPSAPPSSRRARSPISSWPSRSSPGFNYFNGRQVLEPRIEAVQPGSAAEKAGFQPNDLILDDRRPARSTPSPTCSARELQRRRAPGVHGRCAAGQTVTLQATPNFKEQQDAVRQAAHRPSRASRPPAIPAAIKRLTYTPLGRAEGGRGGNLVPRRPDHELSSAASSSGRESADQLSGPDPDCAGFRDRLRVGGVWQPRRT